MNEPLTSERLSSIGESLEDALKTNPAPWQVGPVDDRMVYGAGERGRLIAECEDGYEAAFIADAPDMVRDLLGEVVRLKEERMKCVRLWAEMAKHGWDRPDDDLRDELGLTDAEQRAALDAIPDTEDEWIGLPEFIAAFNANLAAVQAVDEKP